MPELPPPADSELIDQLPSDYIYTEIFKAFDVNQNGFIDKSDLETASGAMGWQTQQGKYPHY